MKQETWKFIENYEGLYEVSNIGRFKGLEKESVKIYRGKIINLILKERFMKLTKSNKGYVHISLCKNNIIKRIFLHRLIAQAFIPNPENKPFINHKNGIRHDNRIENLEWCTAKENINHGIKYGKIKLHTKVLQYDLQNNFIKLWDSIKEAAMFYKVNQSNISNCCRKRRPTCKKYIWKYSE